MERKPRTMAKKYRPSNGTEGEMFMDKRCYQCIHEKWLHTQNDDDAKCEILNNTMLYDVHEDEYPEEWTYDENDKPTCTAWKKWDWGNGDDDDLNEPPPPPPPDDPNQLCMPFAMDEIVETPSGMILHVEHPVL